MPTTFSLFAASWVVMAIAGAVFFTRRAPAVALGLAGALAGGVVGFALAGGEAIPEVVARWAVIGLVGFGVLGSFSAPRASSRFLSLAALGATLSAPLLAMFTWSQMRARCHAYDPAASRFCAGIDLYFGISGVVMFYLGVGLAVLVILLLVSAWRSRVHARSVVVAV